MSINEAGDAGNDFMLDEMTLVLIHVVQITGFRRRKRFDPAEIAGLPGVGGNRQAKHQCKKYYDTCTQTQKSSDTRQERLVRHWLASANL